MSLLLLSLLPALPCSPSAFLAPGSLVARKGKQSGNPGLPLWRPGGGVLPRGMASRSGDLHESVLVESGFFRKKTPVPESLSGPSPPHLIAL